MLIIFAHLLTTRPIEIIVNSTPRTYFNFAIEDLHAISERSLVNSFSNAKRCLHFQIDLLSKALVVQKVKGYRSTFPEKLDFCKKSGLVGTKILYKLNKIRNVMEHEYYIPQQDEVENFIDVVELFLAATGRFIKNFLYK